MCDSPEVYTNPDAKSWRHVYEADDDVGLAQAFHRRLPGYRPTPLVPLPDLAKELGVKAVFVKDESSRLGLPAFKILGASWATFRAVAERTGLPLNSDLQQVAVAAQKAGISLFAATEGNHGRAVARMGKLLSLPARIFMSRYADSNTCRKIESEGAEVTVIQGDYDDAVATAFNKSKETANGLLIQDNSFAGYGREIPEWIVEGYSTLLVEVEEQLQAENLKPTTIVTPVGVGSLAHTVVAHCKSRQPPVGVLTVEPESAACLHHNLKAGQHKTIETSATIMNGLNCGTVSPISWPIFTHGVDASVTVSDRECHAAVQYLHSHGVNAGPCGAASLAGVRKLVQSSSSQQQQKKDDDVVVRRLMRDDAVIVLLSTEGARSYPVPS